MRGRIACVALASWMAFPAGSFAQNGLNDFIRLCGGADKVENIGGGRLGCKSSPTAGGDTTLATAFGLGRTFMQILQGMEADAKRRAAEQKARRNLAMQILDQHRDAALTRQDAVRAQQLQEIGTRLARSENLFKGLTGAGAQLGLKVDGVGSLQMKTGGAAIASLNPSTVPVPSTASSADVPPEAAELIKAFEALPREEQLQMLMEMQQQLQPATETRVAPLPAPQTLLDAIPEGISAEELSATAETLLGDTFGKLQGMLRGGSSLDGQHSAVMAGPPPPPFPDASAGAAPRANIKPCELALSIESSVVDLRCAASHIVDLRTVRGVRSAPSSSGETALVTPPAPPKRRVQPRPPTREENFAAALPPGGPWSPGGLYLDLIRRNAARPDASQRRILLRNAAPALFPHYGVNARLTAQIDEAMDQTIDNVRIERLEFDLETWNRGFAFLYGQIKQYGGDNPSAEALLKIPSFVKERDKLTEGLALEYRFHQNLAALRLPDDLKEALKNIKLE